MAVDVLEFSSFDEPVKGITGERLLKRITTVNYDISNGDKDFLFDLQFIGRIAYIFIKFSNFTGSPNSTVELFRNNDKIPPSGAIIENFVPIPNTIQNIPVGTVVRLDYNLIDEGSDRMIISFDRKGSTAGLVENIIVTMKDFV